FAVGPININAELDIFGGTYETTAAEIDLVGTQFFADISMAMSDALTLGAHLVYSDGTDEADEVKLTHLTDDGSTVFSDYGAMNTLGISPLGPTDIFDADLNGDDFADGTGTTGAGVYVKFMVMESLTLYGQVMYATATEELDNTTGEMDSLMLYNASVKYTIVPNAHVSAQYGYFSIDRQDNVDADAASTLGVRLQIDF
ncbi:MAG: YfaZ family outer membrane protein, partial [Desulfobacteraceae bacterium]